MRPFMALDRYSKVRQQRSIEYELLTNLINIGSVKINITETQLKNADKLRIVFHAMEKTCNSGYLSPVYKNQLFGTQRILWKLKDLQKFPILTPNTDISIPFIIQLPMVQFPPSCNTISARDGLSYDSDYKLSVYLDSKIEGENPIIIRAHKNIMYMPLIETSMMKNPICVTTTLEKLSTETVSIEGNTNISSPSADVRLTSLDYVPGDEIPISISIKNLPKKSIESISIELYQIRTWKKATNCKKRITNNGERRLSNIIAQKNVSIMSITSSGKASSPNEVILSVNTSLEIPSDSTPTFTYSPVFSIKYQLKINIKRKSKIWSFNSNLTNIPISLGTLGYGIRSSEEIKFYSTFKSVFNQQLEEPSENILPVPKFLDFLEYEESLPLYKDYRLPDYD